MFVFVINKNGKPLMPCSPRTARVLLKTGKAKVVSKEPFTIKLLYGSAGYKQEVKAGMDTGSKVIGTAAVANGKVVYQAETALRGDEIKSNLKERSSYRKTRRERKLRYRKPRFLNRGSSTKKGRTPPSVRHKIQAHEREKRFMESRLPITKWNVETASFDIHALSKEDDLISLKGEAYQNGRQKGFYNTKAYILHRDNYKCKYAKGKCGEKLHVHHIVFRSNGGNDKPENLITLCERHHKDLHDGKLGEFLTLEKKLSKAAQAKVKSATQVSMIAAYIHPRWRFNETFGYETKFKREKLGFTKTHYNDAVAICLGENESVKPLNYIFRKRCVSQGDYRQTSGARSEKVVTTGKLFGLRKFDLISTSKGIGFVKGKRSSGYFAISTIDGLTITDSVNVKSEVCRLSARKTVLIIRESIGGSNSSAGLKNAAVSLERIL